MTVTPAGVREGDPAALEALCAVRGPSVVAYCRQIAGEAEAATAAADAFARFRVGVVAAGDTTTLNPEALLISATRTSAAARANITAPGHCASVPMLLASRAERTIDPADLQRLETHLEQCWACRAPVARFKAAERAYRDPPEKTVEPALAAQIVAALIAAVPPPAPPAPVAANGAGPDPGPPVADPHATQSFVVEQHTEHFAAAGMAEPGDDASADAGDETVAAPRRRRESRKAGAGGGALLSRLRPGSSPRAPRERPQPQPQPEPLPEAVAPRERSRRRSRPGLRTAVVLPIILILLALVAALYVSGVFGGSDPASSPRVSAPAPAAPAKAKLVAVPGAKTASGDAVEVAKARERARERGVPYPTKQKTTTQASTAGRPSARQPSAPAATPRPAATPPAAPAAPAVSANHPVTPPAPKRDTSATAPTRIDAGSGATGAEQIPPAADASGVPDLAPPADPTP